MSWDQVKIEELEVLDNKWTWDIKFWFAQVNEGYIVEFIMEYTDSFNEDEINFAEGPRRRMLEEIRLCIKMLFNEKGLMPMEPD